MEYYHPLKSRINSETLDDFLRSPITGDLLEVPGIGPGTKKILVENGITTTFMLIGKYLSLKDETVDTVEHADRFYLWLKSIDFPKSGIFIVTHAMSEKMNLYFPGIYDQDCYIY